MLKSLVPFAICTLMLNPLLAEQSMHSEPVKTQQQISEELQQAQSEFSVADSLFIPWYTGPIITSSANNIPPGNVNLQPYLYFTTNFAEFTNSRHSVDIPNIHVINPLLVFQTGITSWLDVTTVLQGFFKWQKKHDGQGFGDLPLQFGFQIYKQTPSFPSIRLVLGEVFPTGRYKQLDPKKNGLDASGQGVFQTTVGLNISKIFWWIKLHPIALRLATSYSIPNGKAHVKELNAYGGGDGTKGKVSVGGSFNADLGIEISLTQKWVFATDIAYTYSGKSTFSGNLGESASGVPAAVGAPSSDQLSIAPGIEYNVTPTQGFIGGVWFAVTGRNSFNFASLVLSYTVFF